MKLITTENIPFYAIYYLYYGDPTGLNEEDIEIIDAWVDDNFPKGYVMDIDPHESFVHRPAFGLATTCQEVKFYEP